MPRRACRQSSGRLPDKDTSIVPNRRRRFNRHPYPHRPGVETGKYLAQNWETFRRDRENICVILGLVHTSTHTHFAAVSLLRTPSFLIRYSRLAAKGVPQCILRSVKVGVVVGAWRHAGVGSHRTQLRQSRQRPVRVDRWCAWASAIALATQRAR